MFKWYDNLVSTMEDMIPIDKENVRGIFGRPWTARDVYWYWNEEQLKKITMEEEGHVPGSAAFMGTYQRMLMHEFNSYLDDHPDRLQEMEERAAKYNTSRLPKEEQQR